MLKCLARTGPRPQRCNKHGCGTGPRQVRYGACSHTPVGQGSARFAWSADELPINTKTKYFSAVPSNNGCHARLHLEDSVSAHNAQLPIRRRRARDKHKRARLNQQRNIRDPHESPTLRVAHQNRNSHYIARLCEHKCFNVGRLAFGAAAPRHHLFKITAVCACEDFHFARTVSPARQKNDTTARAMMSAGAPQQATYQFTLMPIAFLRTFSAPVQETGFPSPWFPELLQYVEPPEIAAAGPKSPEPRYTLEALALSKAANCSADACDATTTTRNAPRIVRAICKLQARGQRRQRTFASLTKQMPP